MGTSKEQNDKVYQLWACMNSSKLEREVPAVLQGCLVQLIDCSYQDDVRRFESTGDPYFLALIDSDACCIRQHVGAEARGKVSPRFSEFFQ